MPLLVRGYKNNTPIQKKSAIHRAKAKVPARTQLNNLTLKARARAARVCVDAAGNTSALRLR
jgi:hypothetical protein